MKFQIGQAFAVSALTALICVPAIHWFVRFQELQLTRDRLHTTLILLKIADGALWHPSAKPEIIGNDVSAVTSADEALKERVRRLGSLKEYRILKVDRYSTFDICADVELTWERGVTTERFVTLNSRPLPYLIPWSK